MTISQVQCTDRNTLVAMAPVPLCDSCAHVRINTSSPLLDDGKVRIQFLCSQTNTLRPVKGHIDHPIELSIIPLSVLCGHSLLSA